MKKRMLIISLVLVVLIISVCVFRYFMGPIGSYIGHDSKYRNKGSDIYQKYDRISLYIKRRKKCIPVSLNLYDDGTYELFTEYETCRPFETCTLALKYTKSIKGKYDYDLTKILDESIIEGSYDGDKNNINYNLYAASFNTNLGSEYFHDYVISKDKTNKSLEELLDSIDIDLDVCAIPDYR